MRTAWLLAIIGLILILLPFLGLPQNFDDLVYIIIGLGIFALGVRALRASYIKSSYQDFKASVSERNMSSSQASTQSPLATGSGVSENDVV